jgi:hypothetical protein
MGGSANELSLRGTADKLWRRWLAEGEDGLEDRSSRPNRGHRSASSNNTKVTLPVVTTIAPSTTESVSTSTVSSSTTVAHITTTLAPTTTTVPATTTTPRTAPAATTTPATQPQQTAPQTTAPSSAQQGVHPGSFCSPLGASGVISAGTAMICSENSAIGKPYTQPRWNALTQCWEHTPSPVLATAVSFGQAGRVRLAQVAIVMVAERFPTS